MSSFFYFTLGSISILNSSAFLSSRASNNCPQFFPNQFLPSQGILNAIPTPEESAQALTDYMTKSHEEKLKQMKLLEEKKNVEIDELKRQLVRKETSIENIAIADLTTKLETYQQFLAKYIVKAQEDKARAVREAEITISKKYESKLKAFMLPPTEGTGSLTTSSSTKMNPEYQIRSMKVKEAAAVGKSRWGPKEVERSSSISTEVFDDKNGEIQHEITPIAQGVSVSDGGENGLTVNGVKVQNAEKVLTNAINPNLSYMARNDFIVRAKKSGKQSRWGSEEERKAIEFNSQYTLSDGKQTDQIMTPEVAAADHGLRADGGVGGPSLAERVNLGARLLHQ